MRRLIAGVCVIAIGLLVIVSGSGAKQSAGAPFTLVENATLVHPGDHSNTAAQASSTGPTGPNYTWGAVNLSIPAGMTLSQLNNLSTDYKLVLGPCYGGSPRFEAWVNTGTATHKVFFYFSQTENGCPTGVWTNTGNLASPNSLVDDDQLGGGYADRWSTVQANYGSYPVTAVYLDVDGGWYTNETDDFDNTQVNNELFTYGG